MTAFSWVGNGWTWNGNYTTSTTTDTPYTIFTNNWTPGMTTTPAPSFQSVDDGGYLFTNTTPPPILPGWNKNVTISSEGGIGFFKGASGTAVNTPYSTLFSTKSRMYFYTSTIPDLALVSTYEQDSGVSSYAHAWNSSYYCYTATYAYYSNTASQPTDIAVRIGNGTLDVAIRKRHPNAQSLEVVTTNGGAATTRLNSYTYPITTDASTTTVFNFTSNTGFPNAPTGLAVANSPVPNGNTANASWTFSDPDAGQTQSAYQFRWRRVGN